MNIRYNDFADLMYIEDETKKYNNSETIESDKAGAIVVDFDEKGRVVGLELVDATQVFDLDRERIKKFVEKLKMISDEKKSNQDKTYSQKLEKYSEISGNTDLLYEKLEKNVFEELKEKGVDVFDVQVGKRLDIFIEDKVTSEDLQVIKDVFDDMEVVEVFVDNTTFKKRLICVTVG